MVHSRVKHLSLIAVVFVWNSVEYILDCININMVAICTKKLRKKNIYFLSLLILLLKHYSFVYYQQHEFVAMKSICFPTMSFFSSFAYKFFFIFIFADMFIYKNFVGWKNSVACRRICKKKNCISILFNCVHIACCQGKTISCSKHEKTCLFCNHSAKRVFICRVSNWNMFEYLNCHRSK